LIDCLAIASFYFHKPRPADALGLPGLSGGGSSACLSGSPPLWCVIDMTKPHIRL
jgi:hypothetical protein